MSKIDHEYTDEVVCPACGFEHSGSWEWFRDGASRCEIDCESCGVTFIAHVGYDVSYITELGAAAPARGNGEGEG